MQPVSLWISTSGKFPAHHSHFYANWSSTSALRLLSHTQVLASICPLSTEASWANSRTGNHSFYVNGQCMVATKNNLQSHRGVFRVHRREFAINYVVKIEHSIHHLEVNIKSQMEHGVIKLVCSKWRGHMQVADCECRFCWNLLLSGQRHIACLFCSTGPFPKSWIQVFLGKCTKYNTHDFEQNKG